MSLTWHEHALTVCVPSCPPACFPACRNVSGTRVLANGKQQTVAGITFSDYGTHTSGYPHPYLNAAAAIGGNRQEVDVFVGRLLKAYRELQDKWAMAQAGGTTQRTG